MSSVQMRPSTVPAPRERHRSLPRIARLAGFVVAGCVLPWLFAQAQGLTGTLIVAVGDQHGAALGGARVRVSSPELMGGSVTLTTNEHGQSRLPTLPPGTYVLDIELPGFAAYHEVGIAIGAGETLERAAVLRIAGVAASIVVEGSGSRIEARDSGFGTRFGFEDLRSLPTRRASMFDLIRAAPGISPTSPSSGTVTTVSAFGSGTNENQFLFDGTNFTCPCNGTARADPGVDFIQEVAVHSVGASAEFGNVQGAVINVVTRQGSDRFLHDASYYRQWSGLTSHPVRLALAAPAGGDSAYERTTYRDLSTTAGGPLLRHRLWFFTGYQHLRDSDSQPGTDPRFPRAYEQDTLFAKLTWNLGRAVRLTQSYHEEFWTDPERPTVVTPPEATIRSHGTVPAITFGHLTHTWSDSTLWDVRVGRFVHDQENEPATGDPAIAGRFDRVTGVSSGAPRQFGSLRIARTSAKATISRLQHRWGADHQVRIGGQIERGENEGSSIIPGGVRFVDSGGRPFQAISGSPSNGGGLFVTAAAFLSDAVTVGNRFTINAGLRFDHNRATSQDLPALDLHGRATDEIIRGLGRLYTWNVLSPRLGVTAKLSGDGRTMLRGTYGRFSQGVLTGELTAVHPGGRPLTTTAFDPATGAYTRVVSVLDPRINVQLDPGTRAPHTDEYSVGVDRELGRRVAVAVAYVRKDGDTFIGWTDVGGQYRQEARILPDGHSLPVFALVNAPAARRYLLTNPPGYSLTYDGLVIVVERRRANGWHAFGSYTLSRARGLQPSSGATAAGPQASTIAPPSPITFGRDPNDLTNARGRLPNDRPHVVRLLGGVDVPRLRVRLAGNLQIFSGKPWAATAQVALPQGDQRVLLEPRGTRRLSTQALLDLRISRTFAVGGVAQLELLLDVLNVLDETAEEGLATDTLISPNFGRPSIVTDPRRAMVGLRLNFGR